MLKIHLLCNMLQPKSFPYIYIFKIYCVFLQHECYQTEFYIPLHQHLYRAYIGASMGTNTIKIK